MQCFWHSGRGEHQPFSSKRNSDRTPFETREIFYARVDELWRKEEKYNYLEAKQHYHNIEWQQMNPDKNYTWLTEGLHAEFDTFIPIGSKKAKATKSSRETM